MPNRDKTLGLHIRVNVQSKEALRDLKKLREELTNPANTQATLDTNKALIAQTPLIAATAAAAITAATTTNKELKKQTNDQATATKKAVTAAERDRKKAETAAATAAKKAAAAAERDRKKAERATAAAAKKAAAATERDRKKAETATATAAKKAAAAAERDRKETETAAKKAAAAAERDRKKTETATATAAKKAAAAADRDRKKTETATAAAAKKAEGLRTANLNAAIKANKDAAAAIARDNKNRLNTALSRQKAHQASALEAIKDHSSQGDKIRRDSARLTEELRTANLNAAIKANKDAAAAANKYQRESSGLSRTLLSIERSLNNATKTLPAYTSALQRAERATRKLREINDKVDFGRIRAGARGALRNVNLLNTSLVGFGLGFSGIAIAKAGIELNVLKARLEAATDSIEDAELQYRFLRKTSNDLSIDFVTLADGHIRLLNAFKNTPIEGRKTNKALLDVSIALRVLKLDAIDTARVYKALVQIVNKPSVYTEEITQLGETIPAAARLAQEALNADTSRFRKEIEAGNIEPYKFVPIFLEKLRDAYKKGLPASIKTTQAALVRFRNSYRLAFQEAGNSTDGLINSINRLNDLFSSQSARESIKSYSRLIYDSFSFVLENQEVILAVLGGLIGAKIGALSSNPLVTGIAAIAGATAGYGVGSNFEPDNKYPKDLETLHELYNSESVNRSNFGDPRNTTSSGTLSPAGKQKLQEIREAILAAELALEDAERLGTGEDAEAYQLAFKALERNIQEALDNLELQFQKLSEKTTEDAVKNRISRGEFTVTDRQGVKTEISDEDKEQLLAAARKIDEAKKAQLEREEALRATLRELEEAEARDKETIKEKADNHAQAIANITEQRNSLGTAYDQSLMALEAWRKEQIKLLDPKQYDYTVHITEINRIYQESLDRLNASRVEYEGFSGGIIKGLQDIYNQTQDVVDIAAGGIKDTFNSLNNTLADFITKGKFDLESFGNDLVAIWIRTLAQLVIQQQIINPIANATLTFARYLAGLGGGKPNVVNSVPVYVNPGVPHTGGIAGSERVHRTVPIHAFYNAQRLHSGGIVGLQPDEVPAILQRGERVIPKGEVQTMNTPNITLVVQNNTNTPIGAEQGQARIDGDNIVMDILLDNIARNTPQGRTVKRLIKAT